MTHATEEETALGLSRRIGTVVSGVPQTIGEGFTANHFAEAMFNGRMDPLLMVDHFVMTGPTFAPHLHAGISAVTALFEDSLGTFLNRDSLGHNLALVPGDLYWLAAGRGAAHEEKPSEGGRTHALQIFVNMPTVLKTAPARALHVHAKHVPVLKGHGYRVRVVLGQSSNAVGTRTSQEDMTMLDGFLDAHVPFVHRLPEAHQAWIYAVSGVLTIRFNDDELVLHAGEATTIAAGPSAGVELEAGEPSHFVLIEAKPIRA